MIPAAVLFLPSPARVECAWCSMVMRPGVEPVSHSICGPCVELHFPAVAAKRAARREEGARNGE